MNNLFQNVYKNKVVLVTGHTGFKGSWLCLWLREMGAKVIGYSLEPETTPNHFNLLDIDMVSVIGDILDKEKLIDTIKEYKPEIIFHLAAQPIVNKSYIDPMETFEVNIMGTVYMLECCRKFNFIKSFVNITSDKCYENIEQDIGYKESDRLGGFDPYSASKGCSEIVTSSYLRSFFNNKDNTSIASARAGNVIGGGDWANFRLIPDIMKDSSKKNTVEIRSPKSTRPWQHVLEPLSGYLLLGSKLLLDRREFIGSWNFGPNDSSNISVGNLIDKIKEYWENISYKVSKNNGEFHEAKLLRLDCSKANNMLNWHPVWDIDTTLEITVEWYKSFYINNEINSLADLKKYVNEAKNNKAIWTQP
tara:strand:+ start:20585 stop:21670 length:1086 start_codon:yes stop_codon:yes gene_type:complete